MSTSRPTNNYSGSQTELYQICRIGWQSYLDYVADFTALNSNYDIAFGTAALAEVDAAQSLPDFQARDYVSEALRIQLVEAADDAINNWKMLRSHIAKAFPPPMFETSIEAAGSEYYNDATHEDWEELKQMMVSGGTFLTANTAALTAIGMPAAFPADYDNAKTAFETILADFMTAEQAGKEGTDEKLIANNALYDKLQNMFADGRLIFENDAATRDRFIYSKVKQLVSSNPGNNPNEVTIQGFLRDNQTNDPIENALIDVGGHTTTTQGDGSFLLKFVVDETTTLPVTITADNYEMLNTTYQVEPGQTYTQNIEMTFVGVSVGSISGTVRDAGTLMGVGGASVSIVNGNTVINVNTDAGGNFSKSGIEVGMYTATASAPGYITDSDSVIVNANSNTVKDFSLVVAP